MLPWSRSHSCSKLPRLCIPESGRAVPSLRLRVLLTTRRAPGCPRLAAGFSAVLAQWGAQSVLSGAARTFSQVWETHKDDRGIAQWIPSSGVPGMQAFRVCPVLWIYDAHAIT